MNVLTGVKELRRLQEEQGARGIKTGDGGTFLKIDDGQSVTLRFMQELDSSGKYFDEERGLAVAVFEHSNPDNFSQRFLCTSQQEGKCVGCERKALNPRWGKRARMYLTAFVKELDSVKIVATNFSPKGFGSSLIEYFDDYGSSCDRWYKLKRTGAKLATSYTLLPREPSDFDFEGVNGLSLDRVTEYKSYDDVLKLIEGSTE